ISQEGGSEEEIELAVKESMKSVFLPEFINRIDEVILFHPLQREQIRRIVDLQLGRLEAQLATNDVGLEVTLEARDAIAAQGYDPVYGARPLKRVIQQQIQNPLATEILKGAVKVGSTVRIDVQAGEFVFSANHAAP